MQNLESSSTETEGSSFDATYYATGCGAAYVRNDRWLAFFDGIAARIISDIAPASMLDAGCAMGFLVERMNRRGVPAWGIDISEYAISQAHESIKDKCEVGSIAKPFSRQFDLITCIEVVEHMPKAEAEQAIANLCAHTGDILFTSSPKDYTEATHINVHPPEYWAETFARQGFIRDLTFDASFITPWAARFRKSSEPAHRIVHAYERHLSLLNEENQQLRQAMQVYRQSGASLDVVRRLNELEDLVARYEQGRFMRAMRWLRGGRR